MAAYVSFAVLWELTKLVQFGRGSCVPSVACYSLFLPCAGALATASSRERLQHPRAREESARDLKIAIESNRCIRCIASCVKKRSSGGRKRISDQIDADLDFRVENKNIVYYHYD